MIPPNINIHNNENMLKNEIRNTISTIGTRSMLCEKQPLQITRIMKTPQLRYLPNKTMSSLKLETTILQKKYF